MNRNTKCIPAITRNVSRGPDALTQSTTNSENARPWESTELAVKYIRV